MSKKQNRRDAVLEAAAELPAAAESVGEVPESGLRAFLREWRGFFVFVALMLIFRSVIADWNHVPSGSMRPTLLIGDRVVVNKMAFDLRVPFTFIRLSQHSNPERGDIITFEGPGGGKLLIKRVIGVPGDRVQLRRNRLYINGIAADYRALTDAEIEPLQLPDADDFGIYVETILGHSRIVLHEHRPGNFDVGYSTYGPVSVPEGKYLVLGDNRDNSGDTRQIGLVPRESILGRAHSVAFSLDYDNYYIPRSDRAFKGLALPAETAQAAETE